MTAERPWEMKRANMQPACSIRSSLHAGGCGSTRTPPEAKLVVSNVAALCC